MYFKFQSSLIEASNNSLASSTSSGVVNSSSSSTDITTSGQSDSTTDVPSTLTGTWASWSASADVGGLERPHTISTAYERSHARPALTAHTFEAPATSQTAPATPNPYAVPCIVPTKDSTSDPAVNGN